MADKPQADNNRNMNNPITHIYGIANAIHACDRVYDNDISSPRE